MLLLVNEMAEDDDWIEAGAGEDMFSFVHEMKLIKIKAATNFFTILRLILN